MVWSWNLFGDCGGESSCRVTQSSNARTSFGCLERYPPRTTSSRDCGAILRSAVNRSTASLIRSQRCWSDVRMNHIPNNRCPATRTKQIPKRNESRQLMVTSSPISLGHRNSRLRLNSKFFSQEIAYSAPRRSSTLKGISGKAASEMESPR